MMKVFSLGLFLISAVGALGQKPTSLEVFKDQDRAFQFSYPDNYELLSGERILKATQGRHLGFPVCDFSKAVVCVIYPVERLDNDKFEAAGFSVDVVPDVTAESDCQEFTDRVARSNDEHSPPSSFNINGRVFHHVSADRRMGGHAQSSDLYRTFQKDRCYELRVAISFADEASGQQRSSLKSIESAEAESVRGSLKLLLSTFVFKQ